MSSITTKTGVFCVPKTREESDRFRWDPWGGKPEVGEPCHVKNPRHTHMRYHIMEAERLPTGTDAVVRLGKAITNRHSEPMELQVELVAGASESFSLVWVRIKKWNNAITLYGFETMAEHDMMEKLMTRDTYAKRDGEDKD